MAAIATELAHYQMYIGGKWTDAVSGETFESYNPFTAQPWALIPRAGADDVDRAVQAAHRAFTEGGMANGYRRPNVAPCCASWVIC
jgi:acyl-CoA reductase-like NAD-dependent aldehyde dehydrogenase